MTEILTSYHRRGMEEGMEKGNIAALQRTLLKQVRKKLGSISLETEKIILGTASTSPLEKALEFIFDLDSEKSLLDLLNNNN